MTAPTETKATTPVKIEAQPTRMRDPFDFFDTVPREMARIWGDMWPILPRPMRAVGRPAEAWTPRMDIYEKNGDLVVKAELPGVKNEDIHVTVEGDTLSVEGERKTESEVKEEDYYRSERTYGRFYRYLPLDFTPDPDKVKASFKDGVLELRIPRPAQKKSNGKTIPIAN